MTNPLTRGVPWRHRARNVSTTVFHGHIDLGPYDQAELEKNLLETVERECWNPGEVLLVDTMVPHVTAARMLDWAAQYGVRRTDLVDAGTVHACEGSLFHEDSDAYANTFFCVAWMDEADPWDLYFPESQLRIALRRGTVVLFDPSHVHGVVARGQDVFEEEALGENGVQPFSSLCIKSSPHLMRRFGSRWRPLEDPALNFDWRRRVDPYTGRLLAA